MAAWAIILWGVGHRFFGKKRHFRQDVLGVFCKVNFTDVKVVFKADFTPNCPVGYSCSAIYRYCGFYGYWVKIGIFSLLLLICHVGFWYDGGRYYFQDEDG